MSRTLLAVGIVIAALVVVPPSVRAQGRCVAAKEKCVAKKVTRLLACNAAAESRGTAVDPACLEEQGARLNDPITGCFVKAEGAYPPCPKTGDAGTVEALVDAFVDDVVSELDPQYPA